MSKTKKIEETKKIIQEDIKNNHVVLFMKGEKEMPQCGFSAKVVEILNALNVAYVTRNVLLDENLRQAIKEYSNWPTIPQLYVKEEFIGGCDIIMELQANNELKEIVR